MYRIVLCRQISTLLRIFIFIFFLQSSGYIFGAHTKRRPLTMGDRVLALSDPGRENLHIELGNERLNNFYCYCCFCCLLVFLRTVDKDVSRKLANIAISCVRLYQTETLPIALTADIARTKSEHLSKSIQPVQSVGNYRAGRANECRHTCSRSKGKQCGKHLTSAKHGRMCNRCQTRENEQTVLRAEKFQLMLSAGTRATGR